MGNGMIKLLIVDDHAMIRTAFSSALAKHSDMNVIGDAATGEDGVKLARDLKPDVILMDVNLPGISGLEAASRILQQSPKSKLIAVTALEDSPFPRKFLEIGASGFVTKACPLEELVQAIRTVAAGGKYISPHVAQSMALDSVNGKAASPFDSLTKRETEIVVGIVQGEDMGAIGVRLHVSAKTVASHKYNAFAKLGVESDVALARMALAHGLVESVSRS
jgi:two-component system, NarL family, invasion response regulator UvrY